MRFDTKPNKEIVEAAIRRVVAGVAASLRLEYEIDWIRQTPVMVNTPRIVARVRDLQAPVDF